MSLPRLHILTDTTVQQRHSHLRQALAAWSAGHIAVQYRNKHHDPAQHGPMLAEIARHANTHGHLLIINDQPALALDLRAGGVHLGVQDASIAEARALLGPRAIIGATVHDTQELSSALASPCDYLGIGPVYGSRSKNTGLPPLGLQGLADLAAASDRPVIAIGNIQLTDIPAVMATGVHGIAVISAYCMADDLEARAKQLLDAVHEAL